MSELWESLVKLFILAIPTACISWTVTHEKVFEEFTQYCQNKSERCKTLMQRKFFYLFTCEYCFSHYVAIFMLAITGFTLFFDDWRGYMLAWFTLVWIANAYMSLFGRLRVDIKSEKAEAEIKEKKLK